MAVTQTLFLQEPGDANAVSINDVNQGWLGDCWLCAPVAALALQNPAYIQNMIRDNGDGTQSVRLYLNPSEEQASHFKVAADGSTWITVNDSDLGQGMNTNNGGQLIVNGVQEIWPQVIENAIAQVLGGYSVLNSGGIESQVMQLLTGNATTESALFGVTGQPITAQLQADLAAGDMVTFLTGAPDSYGLVSDHVYTLTSVDTENGIDYAHLRNPWGYDNPPPVPVSALSSAFLLMDVGTVPTGANTEGAPITVGTTSPEPSTGSSTTGTTTGTTTSSTPTSTPSATSGLVIDVSEDAYQGDAQFTITVDGQQVGGVMTATALHGQGQTQAVDIGSLPTGQHTIGVTFLNDAYAGTPQTDRNLYVDQVYYNGQSAGGPQTLLSNGSVDFTLSGDQPTASTTSTSAPDPSNIAPASTPASGELVVNVSEDAYQGDAQFTVRVDGQQVGGVMTATALHGQGQTQAVDFGNVLSAGQHTIAVSFLNDAYAGTPQTDRNLYVDGITVGGQSQPNASSALYSAGTGDFSVRAASGATPITNNMVLNVSEDAYQGDAQFTVSVDGQQYGGIYTATASHAQGQSEAVTISGVPEFLQQHDVAVTFLNDAYAGTPETDRNLYVNSIQFDGQNALGATLSLYSAGTQHLTAMAPANWLG